MSKEKTIAGVQTRELQLRTLTPEQIENRQAEFVISSDAVDTYGTVFRPDGGIMERYEQNPIVCYNHRSYGDNPDTIIGVGEVFRDGNQWIGRVTFESAEDNPLADKVFRKVQNGTLRMASIAANVKRGHWGDRTLGEDPDVIYFDEWELYEWSVVGIGSNPDAYKRNTESLEAIKADMLKNIPVNEPNLEPGASRNAKLSTKEAQFKFNQNRSKR
jgi:HK97 family phage prohead protease